MASFAAKTGIETDGSRGGTAFRYEDLIILLQEAGDLLLLRTDLGFIDQDAERIHGESTVKAFFCDISLNEFSDILDSKIAEFFSEYIC